MLIDLAAEAAKWAFTCFCWQIDEMGWISNNMLILRSSFELNKKLINKHLYLTYLTIQYVFFHLISLKSHSTLAKLSIAKTRNSIIIYSCAEWVL